MQVARNQAQQSKNKVNRDKRKEEEATSVQWKLEFGEDEIFATPHHV